MSRLTKVSLLNWSNEQIAKLDEINVDWIMNADTITTTEMTIGNDGN